MTKREMALLKRMISDSKKEIVLLKRELKAHIRAGVEPNAHFEGFIANTIDTRLSVENEEGALGALEAFYEQVLDLKDEEPK